MATKKNTNRFEKSIEIIEQNEILQNQLTLDNPQEGQTEALPQLIKINNNPASPINNILDSIKIEPPKKSGTQKSIYLSKQVSDALQSISKQKGMSESKLIDTILSQVLLGK